jgi:HK97 family phage prohead protease
VDSQTFGLRIKSLDESGKFAGVGAVYNNVDLGGDKILPGAFKQTLAEGRQIPVLWQHKSDQPIGAVKVTDSPQGLMVEGQLLMDLPQAKIAYTLLKAKVINGLSIGYDTVKSAMNGAVRELQEIRLWEISVVTFPMNESAQVTSIKSMSSEDLGKHLKEIDRHRRIIDRSNRAMREHLKALSDDFDDDDDADDPDMGEGDDLSEQDSKEFLIEMQKMLAIVKA